MGLKGENMDELDNILIKLFSECETLEQIKDVGNETFAAVCARIFITEEKLNPEVH